jgi:hypothetical protein
MLHTAGADRADLSAFASMSKDNIFFREYSGATASTRGKQ